MAGMGPPPKPQGHAVRGRALDKALLRLPAEGRAGPVPDWPLSRPTKAELQMWEQLWASPQAIAWERLGWLRVVGRYCRVAVAAEARDATAAVMGEARQMEDRLGLTPMAMLRLRWEVVADEVTQQRQETRGARDRIRAV